MYFFILPATQDPYRGMIAICDDPRGEEIGNILEEIRTSAMNDEEKQQVTTAFWDLVRDEKGEYDFDSMGDKIGYLLREFFDDYILTLAPKFKFVEFLDLRKHEEFKNFFVSYESC